MVSEEKIVHLLGRTKEIIEHQRELKKARSETFNVFSILSMEHSENKTHSAFLAELLNPEGSHLKGNAFLRLFLKVLKDESIDFKTAQVKAEHYIGPRNDNVKTGGRIDIYIWDKNGASISIENKIYAGDQVAQIERYCNYRKGRNKVYYLTLKGNEPSDGSKGELTSGTHFSIISYRDQIQEWLDRCIKESAEQPILRESIKQYKILIQKLTSTMDKSHQQKLKDIMLKHVRESAYIAENFAKVSANLKEQVRQCVLQRLRERLGERYTIHSGDEAHKYFSQIWIKIKGLEKEKMLFGLESFSGQGNFNGDLFIGVFNQTGKKNKYFETNDRYSNHWLNTLQLPNFNQYRLNLSNPETLEVLYADKAFLEEFVSHIVNEVEAYLEQHVNQLRDFLITERLATAN